MKKATAVKLLGGTQVSVARHLGITANAVSHWPETLSKPLADKVLAAAVRMRAELLRATGQQLHPLEDDAVTL